MKLCHAIFLCIILFFACRKERILTATSVKLNFSTDTILFDTVFTTIGSATHYLKVFNPNKSSIIISSIQLGRGNASNFRINVDGVSGTSFKNVELNAKDSLFIFIEVTVDPNGGTTPLVITDSILFMTNGNQQDIKLVAWGQDAYFYRNVLFGNYILRNDKPHVIYGLVLVDSARSLIIEKGSQLFFHQNAALVVYKDATLRVNGTKDEPVVFQGDRLEDAYKDVPGQWDRIWLTATSRNNEINYAIIRNGNIGIHVDSTGNTSNPTLKIKNTIIENMSGVGLLAQGSYVEAENCVITNCGQYVLALVIGGNYSFTHCTFANYWQYDAREIPLLLLNNYYKDVNEKIQVRALNNAYFGNCIVYGNIANEVGLDENTDGIFKYQFDYCLLKTDMATTDTEHFINIVKNPKEVKVENQLHDPIFKDVSENDYQLFDLSAAKDKGKSDIGLKVPLDILRQSRTIDSSPDLGAFEFIP